VPTDWEFLIHNKRIAVKKRENLIFMHNGALLIHKEE
jgi:hypothetical protein